MSSEACDLSLKVNPLLPNPELLGATVTNTDRTDVSVVVVVTLFEELGIAIMEIEDD